MLRLSARFLGNSHAWTFCCPSKRYYVQLHVLSPELQYNYYAFVKDCSVYCGPASQID